MDPTPDPHGKQIHLRSESCVHFIRLGQGYSGEVVTILAHQQNTEYFLNM